MAFNPLDWFRPSVAGEPAEPRKQFVAGLVVWVLAWLVVWWIQDKRAEMTAAQQSFQKAVDRESPVLTQTTDKVHEVLAPGSSKASTVSWLGTFLAMGLFWGGGLLIYRPLTGWGFFLSWLRRCQTVERLALVSAAVLTLLAIMLHWIWNLFEAWMLAAVIAALILAAAFGWKLPGRKQL